MSAQCGIGSCDAESGLASYCGGLHIQLPRNLFSRTKTTPDLTSVVPARRLPPLREIVQGRIGFCLKQTCIPSLIQSTRHFIDLFVVETQQFVYRFVPMYICTYICTQMYRPSCKATTCARHSFGYSWHYLDIWASCLHLSSSFSQQL